MTLLTHTKPHLLISNEGFNLKAKSDITDPYYFSLAFIPNDMTLLDCQEKFDEVAVTPTV